MADVPAELQCRLDAEFPGEADDYTNEPLDKETEDRITRLLAEDTNTDIDWALQPRRVRGA